MLITHCYAKISISCNPKGKRGGKCKLCLQISMIQNMATSSPCSPSSPHPWSFVATSMEAAVLVKASSYSHVWDTRKPK
ncbi:hypothetical protein LIER_05795 [Lithospermum erythrorhizon]|uniref:Uncharacterized protein n=1 Tax=Lithospermum erythrorhizon TaxID=34254 RepID=A0AAV3P6R7_LITER